MQTPPSSSSGPTPESMHGIGAEALLSLRADMLRFARLQLRDAETAEDLVQESIEAALRKASSFAGQSTLKTWVFAILRNRIIDHLRLAARTVTMSSLVDDDEDWQERLETLFNDASAPQTESSGAPDRLRQPRCLATKVQIGNGLECRCPRSGQGAELRAHHSEPASACRRMTASRSHWFAGSLCDLACQKRLIAISGSFAGWGT
jgi:RNA polymerase sigma factor (sigma-70 family)